MNLREIITRKVQQIGEDTSFILTLPKTWCKINGITKGLALDISLDQEEEGPLLITSSKSAKDQKKYIELPFSPLFESDTLSRAILQRYLDGFEIIKIINVPKSGKNKLKAKEQIDQLVHKLYGSEFQYGKFEIQVSNEIVSPRSILQEMFEMTNKMVEDSVNAYVKQDDNLVLEVKILENEVDKLYFHIVRTVKSLLRDPIVGTKVFVSDEFTLLESLDLRMIASYLENLADSAENVANLVQISETQVPFNKTIEEKLINLTKGITNNLDKSFRYFQDNDYDKAVVTLPTARRFLPRIEKLRSTKIHLDVIRILEDAVECIIDICDLVGE